MVAPGDRVEVHGVDPYGPPEASLSLRDLCAVGKALGASMVACGWVLASQFGLGWPVAVFFVGAALVVASVLLQRSAPEDEFRQGWACLAGKRVLLTKAREHQELQTPSIRGYTVHDDWVQLYVEPDPRARPALAIPTLGANDKARVVAWLDRRRVRRLRGPTPQRLL